MNERGVASPDIDAAPSAEHGGPKPKVDGRPPRLPRQAQEPVRRRPERRGAPVAVVDAPPREPAAPAKGTIPDPDRTEPTVAEGADTTTGARSGTDIDTDIAPESGAGGPAGRPRPAPAADRDPVAAVAEKAESDDRPAPTEAAVAAVRADFTAPGRLDGLGDPPRPPFEPAEAPYRWTASLPSAVGRKVEIRIADDVIDVAGTPVPIDSVTEAVFRVQVEAAILRRAASARLSVALVLDDGSKVRVAARNAASARGSGEIVDVAGYLWSLLGHATQSDSPAAVTERIERGGDIQIARIHLSRIGLSWKSDPIVRWSTVGSVERDGLDIVISHDDGEMRVPLTASDAFVLPVLVPILRRSFA